MNDYEFKIIESENGLIDLEFNCRNGESHLCSMEWCEGYCLRYYRCNQIAEGNDYLISKGY